MIELSIQILLWSILTVSIGLSATGLYTAFAVRKGADVELDTGLALLSLIAGIAPYVGLFGTVWHIIQALSGIGGASLNVAAIAKPISESLYATLLGLGSAILALAAHKLMLILAGDAVADEA